MVTNLIALALIVGGILVLPMKYKADFISFTSTFKWGRIVGVISITGGILLLLR